MYLSIYLAISLTATSLIISRIEYALPIYGFASNTDLKTIKRIMNNSIRTATGAFRSTPLNNLYYETSILTLKTEREILTTKLQKMFCNSNDQRCQLNPFRVIFEPFFIFKTRKLLQLPFFKKG